MVSQMRIEDDAHVPLNEALSALSSLSTQPAQKVLDPIKVEDAVTGWLVKCRPDLHIPAYSEVIASLVHRIMELAPVQPAQTMTKDEKLAYFEARVKPSSDDPEAQTDGLEEAIAQFARNFCGKWATTFCSHDSVAVVVELREALEKFMQGRSLPRQKGEPVAWMTEDSHGRTMLFHDINEARTYCDEDEEPTALYK